MITKIEPQHIERIFSLYWGNELAIDHPNYATGYKIAGVHPGKGTILICRLDNTDFATVNINLCKIILKPFYTISDAHLLQLAEMVLTLPFHLRKKGWLITRLPEKNGFGNILVHHPRNTFSLQIDTEPVNFNIYVGDEVRTSTYNMKGHDCADFLRINGYALPFQLIDLFDIGIAIESPQNK